MTVAWAFTPVSCPRCDGPLQEKGPSRKWRRFFECGQCWATFEPVVERRFQPCGPHSAFVKFLRHTITLQPGRTRRKTGRATACAANPNKRKADDEKIGQRSADKNDGDVHARFLRA
jgi:hypothetical protein